MSHSSRPKSDSENPEKKFNICLFAQPDDRSFIEDPENIIHPETAKAILQKLLAPIRKYDSIGSGGHFSPQQMRYRHHEAIFINACRGSGKTTFLVSILHALQDQKTFNNFIKHFKIDVSDIAKNGKCECRLYPLAMVDPITIKNRESVIISVVNFIWQAVRHHSNIGGHSEDYRHRDFRRDENNDLRHKSYQFEAVKDALRGLALGLGNLDNVGRKDDQGDLWSDQEFVLHHGIHIAHSVSNFEEDFNKFVKVSLDYLDKDAFVIAFDDIDTRFNVGWEILETMRRYLTDDRLKIIVTGDIQLFTLMIRKQQLAEFGKTMIKDAKSGRFTDENHPHDGTEKKSISSQIYTNLEHLVDQAVIKIFKPHNRFTLNSLTYYMNKKYDIKLNYSKRWLPGAGSEDSSAFNHIEILKSINMIIVNIFGVTRPIDLELYRTFFFKLPTRSFVRVLRESLALSRMPSSTSSAGDQKDVNAKYQQANFIESLKTVISSLRDVAVTGAMERGLDPEVFWEDDPNQFMVALANWLTINNRWVSAPVFYPESFYLETNLTLVTCGALLTDMMRKYPWMIIQYMFRFSLPRIANADGVFDKKHINASKDSDGKSDACVDRPTDELLRAFNYHCDLFRPQTLIHVVRRQATWWVCYRDLLPKINMVGILIDEKSLNALSLKHDHKGGELKESNNLVNLLAEMIVRFSVMKSYEPNHKRSGNPKGHYISSFPTLVAFVGRVLKACYLHRDSGQSGKLKREIRSLIDSSFNIQPSMWPNALGSYVDIEVSMENENSENKLDGVCKIVDIFIKWGLYWVEEFNGEDDNFNNENSYAKYLSPILIDRMWTRAYVSYFSLNNLRENEKVSTMAEYIKAAVNIFAHSVVLQSAEQSIEAKRLFANNDQSEEYASLNPNSIINPTVDKYPLGNIFSSKSVGSGDDVLISEMVGTKEKDGKKSYCFNEGYEFAGIILTFPIFYGAIFSEITGGDVDKNDRLIIRRAEVGLKKVMDQIFGKLNDDMFYDDMFYEAWAEAAIQMRKIKIDKGNG